MSATKTLSGRIKSADPEGRFTAVVSTYGPEPDLQGDVVVFGAYQRTISEWAASPNRLPVLFGHQWNDDPFSHLGWVDSMEEVQGLGLVVEGVLDLTNPKAAYVSALLKQRRVKEFSIGYSVRKDHRRSDGATELLDVDLIEISVVLKGADRRTALLGAKAAAAPAGADLAAELLAKGYDRDLVGAVFGMPRARPAAIDLESELLAKGYDPDLVARAFGKSVQDEAVRAREAARAAALARFEAVNRDLMLGGTIPGIEADRARDAAQVAQEEADRAARAAERAREAVQDQAAAEARRERMLDEMPRAFGGRQ